MAASEPSSSSSSGAPGSGSEEKTTVEASEILADFEHTTLTPEQKRFLMAQIGTGKNKVGDSKFVLLQQDKFVEFQAGSIEPSATVYFKANRNCNFVINTRCTKVFVEDCHSCTFTFSAPVLTGVFEIWKCSDSTFNMKTRALTIQADLNRNVHFIYDKREYFHFLIWAGCEDMLVRFLEEQLELPTGLSILAHAFPDLIPDIDQFKVSFVDEKLVSERIVRLPGGYPSTDREADAFDAQVEKNDKIYMEHVRQMVKENPSLLKNLRGNKKVSSAGDASKVKAKPNAPCPCKSGKKYKVCCGNPKLKNPKKMVAEHTPGPIVDRPSPGASIAPSVDSSSSSSSSDSSSSASSSSPVESSSSSTSETPSTTTSSSSSTDASTPSE